MNDYWSLMHTHSFCLPQPPFELLTDSEIHNMCIIFSLHFQLLSSPPPPPTHTHTHTHTELFTGSFLRLTYTHAPTLFISPLPPTSPPPHTHTPHLRNMLPLFLSLLYLLHPPPTHTDTHTPHLRNTLPLFLSLPPASPPPPPTHTHAHTTP